MLYNGFVFSLLVSVSVSLALSVPVDCQKTGKAGKILYKGFVSMLLHQKPVKLEKTMLYKGFVFSLFVSVSVSLALSVPVSTRPSQFLLYCLD